MTECDELRAAVTELIDQGGQHDGPCDNEDWPEDDACSLHVAAYEKRVERVRAWLARMEEADA